jgi:UDP-N-acetylglucosamine 2-epimerase (non-hydrolysing)
VKRILIVFGTRPEAVKMAPVVKIFQQDNSLDVKTCVTAQHREMLDQVLNLFEIKPDFDLNLMKPNQNLFSLTASILLGMKEVFEEYKPDIVLVHGDTTTSTAVALAAFYANIMICHVEAGLRTYNKNSPFPEEINRQLTARLADFHYSPTDTSKENLVKEGISPLNIVITGNTVIDALLSTVQKVNSPAYEHSGIEDLKELLSPNKKLILVTGHRRENHGEGFINICHALATIAQRDDVQIIYPVHLNPNVQKPVYDILGDIANIKLIDPLPYELFVWLMDKSTIILTDSGGIQEEAPSLGKPVLVMRDTTERPEAVDAGTVILVGTDTNKIIKEVTNLLDNQEAYERMCKQHNPYGDGTAAQRIFNHLEMVLQQ